MTDFETDIVARLDYPTRGLSTRRKCHRTCPTSIGFATIVTVPVTVLLFAVVSA